MGYDDVLKHLGEFGRYQKRIYFLLCIPTISCALHKLAWVFLGAKVNHRCQLPYETENATFDLGREWNMTIPWDASRNKPSKCLRLDANFTPEYFEDGIPAEKHVECHSWIYDTSVYKSSAVMEWNLVCEDAWLRATADSIFMTGVLIGSLVFGDLSDRFGRKPTFFISLVLQVVAGIFAAVAPDYISFVIARMVVGATTSGVFLVAYVIGVEMVGPSARLFTGVFCQYFFSLGFILTAFFSYFVKDWRMLQVALTLPGIVFFCYWWFIPESVRWLLAKGRISEVKVLLQSAAKENKVDLPDELIKKLTEEKEEKEKDAQNHSLFDLFKYPNLRKKTLYIFFNWMVISGSYYGLSWNTSNLGGNDYLNFLISGAVEIPGYTFTLLTLNVWGRKMPLCGSMLVGGTVLLLTLAVPSDMNWLFITLAMLGKLAITAAYGAIYIFSAEQFPTVIRNVAIGASSMSARVGGILAPFINLLANYWKPMPFLIFGALAFSGGLMILLLPETMRKQLPETIEDGENFGKKHKADKDLEEEATALSPHHENHSNKEELKAVGA
ncbi:organic cation transporter protein-like [Hetaerina americana]|uniref:organic cation transporter protein-like n=1 Tax=Hetaerina americana TaxID=62018 RepID=UPI003A7F244F